jgi:hypothetical protein
MDTKKPIVGSIVRLYQTHKILLITCLIAIILISFALQLFIFFHESLHTEDLRFDYVQWSESCAGKIYTIDEKNDFCGRCYNDSQFECKWPLDMQIWIGKVQRTLKTGGEIHCNFIIDSVNYYTEKGRYFGITNDSLFTWEVLQANKPHHVEFCCGIQRDSMLTNLLMMEKKYPEVCITKDIPERCNADIYNVSANI